LPLFDNALRLSGFAALSFAVERLCRLSWRR